MLNFLRFDEVEFFLSLPKLPLVMKLEQNNFLAAQQCNGNECCGNSTPTRLFI
jgi:hypothetical protein